MKRLGILTAFFGAVLAISLAAQQLPAYAHGASAGDAWEITVESYSSGD